MGWKPMPRESRLRLRAKRPGALHNLHFPEILIRHRLPAGERNRELMPWLRWGAAVVQGEDLGRAERAVVDANTRDGAGGGLVVRVRVVAQEPGGAGERCRAGGVGEGELLDAVHKA